MGAPVGRFPRVLFLQAPCPLLPRGRESCSGATFGAFWGGCMDGRSAPPAGCSAKGSGDLREGRRRAVRRRTQTRSGNRGRQRARGRPGSPGVETKGWQDRAPPAGPASCPPATGRRIRGRGEHPAGTFFLPRRHGLPRVQNSNFLWCIRTPGWVSSNPAPPLQGTLWAPGRRHQTAWVYMVTIRVVAGIEQVDPTSVTQHPRPVHPGARRLALTPGSWPFRRQQQRGALPAQVHLLHRVPHDAPALGGGSTYITRSRGAGMQDRHETGGDRRPTASVRN